jgi:hypothetical protein
MNVYLEFLSCGRVRAINAANDEFIAIGEYTRVVSLLYPLNAKIIRRLTA